MKSWTLVRYPADLVNDLTVRGDKLLRAVKSSEFFIISSLVSCHPEHHTSFSYCFSAGQRDGSRKRVSRDAAAAAGKLGASATDRQIASNSLRLLKPTVATSPSRCARTKSKHAFNGLRPASVHDRCNDVRTGFAGSR